MSKINKSIVRTIFAHIIGFVVITALILGYMWIDKEYSQFNEEAKALREEYIKNQKSILKNEVNGAIKYIDFEKSQTEIRLKEDIRNRTYEAYSIAMNIYNKNKWIKSDDEIKKLIVDVLRPIRFNNGRGYFFIDTLNGESVLYPVYAELEGKSLIDLQDENGNYIEQEEIKLVKNKKEGFITAHWKKPNPVDEKSYAKITFVKLFAPYNWIIGTGEYVDDVEKNIQDKICQRISQIRFGNNNDQYMFIMDYQGIEKVNGMFPELVGKNLWDLEDNKGIKFVQEQIKLAKENLEGVFTKQYWFKKNSDNTSENLYFVKAIPEWHWVIGTGIRTDEIEAVINIKRVEMEKEVKTRITKISITIFSIILLVIILASIIKNIINKSFNVFFSFFQKASKEYVELDVDKIYYSELKDLAVSANKMIKERNEIEKRIIEVNNRLQRRSTTDGLTGLYNHKYMYENLAKEIKRYEEKEGYISIIMFDIDHFKKVNDIYGHQYGDKVLERVAECIKTQAGSKDIIGRYGGEEFLVILPEQNLENAYEIAENIRKGIKNLIFGNEELKVTISGGVAQLETGVETPEKMVKKADELLYKAKANGRDRIEK